MSSLYLCRDCSGAFHSLDELQRHEREEHETVEQGDQEEDRMEDDSDEVSFAGDWLKKKSNFL